MAIASTHDHENETVKPTPPDGAPRRKGWSAALLVGALTLAGAGKLLMFLWHGAHFAKLSYEACKYFNFCN
jgi:hypothetical protein